MQLKNSQGHVFTTVTTNHRGEYSWPGLPAATYIVTAANPPFVGRTEDPDGVNTPDTARIHLTRTITDADFGYNGGICLYR